MCVCVLCVLVVHLSSSTFTQLYLSANFGFIMAATALDSKPPAVPAKDNNNDPQVDFVLVFQGVPLKYIKSKEKVPESEQNAIGSEYNRLLKEIHSVGLQITSREGKPGSGQILVFVKIPDAILVQCKKEESLSDYLHDVKSSVQSSSTSSLSRSSSMGKSAVHSQATFFSSAERTRHTYDLLTFPKPKGASILLSSKEYPNLKDMTPIHDPAYNKEWLTRWAKFSSALWISNAE